jgi:hypothetical protein
MIARKPYTWRRKSKSAETRWRKAFLVSHPDCEAYPILVRAHHPQAEHCKRRSDQVHERLKRSRGGSPTDPAIVMALCWSCHEWTEAEVADATELGLLIPSWERAS